MVKSKSFQSYLIKSLSLLISGWFCFGELIKNRCTILRVEDNICSDNKDSHLLVEKENFSLQILISSITLHVYF